MEIFKIYKNNMRIICIKGYQLNNIIKIILFNQTDTKIYDSIVKYLQTSDDYKINPGMVIKPKLEILYDKLELKEEFVDKYNDIVMLLQKMTEISNEFIDKIDKDDANKLSITSFPNDYYKTLHSIPLEWYKINMYKDVEFILDVDTTSPLYIFLFNNNLMEELLLY